MLTWLRCIRGCDLEILFCLRAVPDKPFGPIWHFRHGGVQGFGDNWSPVLRGERHGCSPYKDDLRDTRI